MKTELEPSAHVELSRLREDIDRVDRTLIQLLAERVRLAREVGAAKRAAGMLTIDPVREAAVIRQAAVFAREAKLEDDDVRLIFWHIVGLSRRAQLVNEPKITPNSNANLIGAPASDPRE